MTVVVFRIDPERIAATSSDPISADNVVGPSDGRVVESEVDAGPARMEDDVAGHQVAPPPLEADARAASRDAVSGDHVSVAGGDDDAGAVSNAAVAAHPIAVRLHEDPEVGVA